MAAEHNTMANRIQIRRDTTANWANVNPILSDGEMGYDIVTNEIRIGDGSTDWTGLSGNVIGGGGASTGDVTFNSINIIGNDNLRFQPNATVTDGYVDIYLTVGPDIHIDHSGGNLILGPDNWANVRLATEGNVQIRAQDGNFTSTWTFNPDGNLILPLGGTITEANVGLADALILIPANVSYPDQQLRIYSTGAVVEGNHVHLTTGNLYASELYMGDDNYYVKLSNTGNIQMRATTQSLSSTALWTFDSDGTTTLPGNLIMGGNITTAAGTGNVVIEANDGTLRTWTFDSTGVLTVPAIGGDEGGEIAFTKAPNSSLSGNTVVVDQFVNRLRFFESGGGNRGAYIDLAQAASTVGTLLNNRVSGFVNAGANVIMDSLKATVTTSAQRGLSLAATLGSFEANVAGTYANVGGTGGSRASVSITTSPSASLFGWNFDIAGDMATYVITDSTNSRAYRVTMQIGDGYNNNMVSIERLV
jgi:hypothetical protein